MDMNQFISDLLAAATDAEITAAEAFYAADDSFSAMCVQGNIANYSVNTTCGLSLRGLYHGKMGYASTEAFDEQAVHRLITGVKESAELIEDEAVQEIFAGSERYETLDTLAHNDHAPEDQKLAFLLALEKKALALDPRVAQISDAMLQTSATSKTIKNTYGLSLTHSDHFALAYLSVLARDGEKVSSEDAMQAHFRFDELNMEELAEKAVAKALFMLDAKPVKSGKYRTLFAPSAMMDLLSTFQGIFSADNAQQGMSLLAGREGQQIAADCVTLSDDPLLETGYASCPFDAEGMAAYKKNIIDHGSLTTLLHNLKTARKANTSSTGNAAKGGYSSAIFVAPSNFYIAAGQKTLEALLLDIGEGIVITDVTGLHAGANMISGDFSLSAKGYTVKDGKKADAVNQITVAGNFYELLKGIRAVGSDLTFLGSVGSPSVDAGELSIAGE